MSAKALNLQGDVMSIADVIGCTLTDVRHGCYFSVTCSQLYCV